MPFTRGFSWQAVNYAPLVTGGAILAVTLWWVISAKHTFHGPARTVAAPEGAPAPAETAAEPPGPSLIADA